MPAGARNWPAGSPPQIIPENIAIFPELSHTSTGGMVLHAFLALLFLSGPCPAAA